MEMSIVPLGTKNASVSSYVAKSLKVLKNEKKRRCYEIKQQ